jgi:fucose 4-O-acetylase-like acetyltransferase
VARGVAIILVVLSHVGNVRYGEGNGLLWFNTVLVVNMPLFFFVSGYLLFKPVMPPWVGVVRKRVDSLIVPYASWLVIAAVIDVVVLSPSAGARRLVLGLVEPRQGLWFLYVLFECVVIFALLHMVSQRPTWLVISSLALAVGITFLPPHESDLLGKTNLQYLLPYLAIGFVFARTKARWRPHVLAIAVVVSVLFVALGALLLVPANDGWWRAALVSAGAPGIVQVAASRIARYSLGIAAVVAAFSWSLLLGGPVGRAVAVVGVSSIGIYATQGYLILAMERLPQLPVLVTTAVVVAAALAATMVLRRWGISRRLLLGIPPARLHVTP